MLVVRVSYDPGRTFRTGTLRSRVLPKLRPIALATRSRCALAEPRCSSVALARRLKSCKSGSVDTIVSPYAMAYETNLPVYVCRHTKRPLAKVWPALKRYT